MNQHTSVPHKVITAILPKGRSNELVRKLVHERGLARININYARGAGRITPLQHRGVGETTEKEILTIIVEEHQADEIFEYVFFEAEINRAHGGLMYQQPLHAATLFNLPDIEEEK